MDNNFNVLMEFLLQVFKFPFSRSTVRHMDLLQLRFFNTSTRVEVHIDLQSLKVSRDLLEDTI